MPEIKNNFLKSKMNKDLDDRLVPNGEYRDAQNLQISRSEGSSVGEFENIPGNSLVNNGYLQTGSTKNAGGVVTAYNSKVIGQYTDESSGNIFIFSTGHEGSGQTDRDITVNTNPVGVTSGDTWALYNGAVLVNPQVLGIKAGMAIWGAGIDTAVTKGDPIVTTVTATNITVSWATSGVGNILANSSLTFGWSNTIHVWNATTGDLKLLVRGGFLNFSTQSKIYGINLLEDLLFWTDNRNQPRRINVDTAIANAPSSLFLSPTYYTNEDQISVAKYYPYEVPLVLEQNILEITAGNAAVAPVRGYILTMADTTGVKIGDIVTGFPGQGDQELWEVITIVTNTSVTIYNNFSIAPGTYNGTDNINITFSRPTMTNESEIKNENGFTTTVNAVAASPLLAGQNLTIDYDFNNTLANPTGQPTPQVGDYITSSTMTGPSGVGITIADEVCIQSINNITPGTTAIITLTKQVTGALNNDITISANPDYNSTFTGDPDFIEDKFVRFSYRFKFVDNEYSIIAPFSQICFIPRQFGYFGGGQQDSKQDMIDTYSSTVVEWFENRINNIGLKIPLPSKGATGSAALDSLTNDYQIESIEIIYKESDSLTTKILESLNIIDDIAAADISTIPSTSATDYYYTYQYKSSKPYKTLPENQTTRVYDKVPIKALAQEVTANRVTYGNFVENHTPPNALDYETLYDDKSISYNNYAQYPNHSVKQNRTYQAGFILGDRYGRQSSVVLSSNDNNEATAGSTVYIPYKNWNDIQFGSGALPTYEWLGSVLRVKLNNGIDSLPVSATGTPGIYKSYSDTDVDSATVSNGGAGYVVGDTCTTTYPAANTGLGAGFAFTVQSVAAGVITGITITNYGSGYADGQVLNVVGGTGANAQVTITVNPPNVLGWHSYKIVVKQQEQEYYNVYLPGYVSGYPVINPMERGRVAFASLFSDNINKVPRDLNEVGPLQTEFSASIILYGRVNNPNINYKNLPAGEYYTNRGLPWNTQYFPGRKADEVTTVGPIGQDGLELANTPFYPEAVRGEFQNTRHLYDQGYAAATGLPLANDIIAALPWGTAAVGSIVGPIEQSFFNVEQNPLALGIKVGSDQSQPQLTTIVSPILNTLGAYVTTHPNPPVSGDPVATMIPFLSISETEPVESFLDIFWESSTSGDFVALNRAVVADYAGVSSVSATSGAFGEDESSGSVIVSSFNFEDSAGNELTLDGVPTISQVLDNNGNDVTGSTLFIIEQDPAGVANKDFRIKTNSTFWYGKPGVTNPISYSLSFTTSYSSGTYIDVLSNIYTANLTNAVPDNLTFVSTLDATVWVTTNTVIPSFNNLDTSIGTFSGDNGSVDVGGKLNELCWSLAITAAPGGSTATFAIDQCNGTVTVSSGSLSNGTYTITGTLTDASPGCPTCSSDATSLSTDCVINFTVGTPPTDRAICFGEDSAFYSTNDTSCYSGSGQPLEVFFGVSNLVNNGTTTGATGSKTEAYLSGLPGTNYAAKRGGGLATNIRYYNVRAAALAQWQCGLPPVTPAFTTGALSQGIMAVKPRLVKSTAVNTDYTTNYTILYRANAASAWQQATTSAGVVVGTFVGLSIGGAGTGEDSDTYLFDTPGEYAVCNNEVGGPGCPATPGGADFRVDFWDNTTGHQATEGDACTNCIGPL